MFIGFTRKLGEPKVNWRKARRREDDLTPAHSSPALGGSYFDERDRQAVQRRLVRRLENLGYQVVLQPAAPVA